jgi:hypothetical protein
MSCGTDACAAQGPYVSARQVGGGCPCANKFFGKIDRQTGGGCGCSGAKPLGMMTGGRKGLMFMNGGYRATKRNLKYLKRWKSGKSIGYTMTASLKAKGLIPRANGTRKVSNKYRGGRSRK